MIVFTIRDKTKLIQFRWTKEMKLTKLYGEARKEIS